MHFNKEWEYVGKEIFLSLLTPGKNKNKKGVLMNVERW